MFTLILEVFSSCRTFLAGIGAERLPLGAITAVANAATPLPQNAASDSGRPMITSWYIETREGESWCDVSNLFVEWLQKNVSLKTFGFSEGDPVDYAGTRLYNFCFPKQHGENISLFETWAESTGRLFGGDMDGTVHLNNNQIIMLPAKAATPPPPWLR